MEDRDNRDKSLTSQNAGFLLDRGEFQNKYVIKRRIAEHTMTQSPFFSLDKIVCRRNLAAM